MKDLFIKGYETLKTWPFSKLLIAGLIAYILFDRFMERPKSVETINQAIVKTKDAESRLEDAEWLINDLRQKTNQLSEIVAALSQTNKASLSKIEQINIRYEAENDSLRKSVQIRSIRLINQLTKPK